MSKVSERIRSTVDNIMSGDNACGTLRDAVVTRDAGYFRRAVAPALETYDEEYRELLARHAALVRREEGRRRTLEYAYANGVFADEVSEVIKRELGIR